MYLFQSLAHSKLRNSNNLHCYLLLVTFILLFHQPSTQFKQNRIFQLYNTNTSSSQYLNMPLPLYPWPWELLSKTNLVISPPKIPLFSWYPIFVNNLIICTSIQDGNLRVLSFLGSTHISIPEFFYREIHITFFTHYFNSETYYLINRFL